VISQLRLPQPCLVAHVQSAFLSEAKVGYTAVD
jgi:hypothetical protein